MPNQAVPCAPGYSITTWSNGMKHCISSDGKDTQSFRARYSCLNKRYPNLSGTRCYE